MTDIAEIADPMPKSPPRKRQRPGLSCLECRRRKVKCDQARPCNQCTKGRRPGCSYGSLPDANVPPTHPWASGRPQDFEAPKDTRHKTAPSPRTHVSASSPKGLMGDVTGSPNSEHDVEFNGEIRIPHHFPQSFPTPGTSPRVPLVGPDRRASTAATAESASAGQTPRSNDVYQVRWAGSDQRPLPNSRRPSSPSIDNLIRQVNRTDHDAYIPKRLSTASLQSKPMDSDITAHGENAGHQTNGILSKNRLYGPSHWMCYFDQFEKVYRFCHSSNWEDHDEISTDEKLDIHDRLGKCKDLARTAKKALAVQRPLLGTDLEQSVPSREIADHLVQLYMINFEPMYRILHIPSFEREYALYWDNPKSASTVFLLKLVLVLSIGTCLYPNRETKLRCCVRQWIYAAQSWSSSPFEKTRLNLSGLQIHCLLLIARQVNAVESDLAWLSAGSLLRMAMQMGLHRDPKHLPGMSVLSVELRRRLWATVIEMAVQSSLDSGMPPLFSYSSFDTLPPSNIDDEEFDETTENSPRPADKTTFTRTSLQQLLLKSLRIRHAIIEMISEFDSNASYDDILQTGKALTAACRESRLLMQIYSRQASSSDGSPLFTAFHRNSIEYLLRSFLLVLHRPSARKADEDPKFYFSRKVCLENALALMEPEYDDHFTRLMMVGAGFTRSVFIHCGGVVCLELIKQLEEDSANMTLQRNSDNRRPIRRAAQGMLELAEKRVELGETNVRGHMFFSMVMGQIKAMEAGTSQERGIFEGARKSADICYDLLKGHTSTSTAVPTNITSVPSANNGITEPQEVGLGSNTTNAAGDVQNFDLDLLQGGIFDSMQLPDSWLFTDWDIIGEE